MEKPLYTTIFFGNKVSVYPDHLFFRKLWGLLGTTTIPINGIASVDISLIGILVIESTGGKKSALPFVGIDRAKKLKEAILKAQRGKS
jgi:hypothetical protein